MQLAWFSDGQTVCAMKFGERLGRRPGVLAQEEEEEENADSKPSAAQEGEEEARSIRHTMPFSYSLRLLLIRRRSPCAWLHKATLRTAERWLWYADCVKMNPQWTSVQHRSARLTYLVWHTR
jgi:hypothetical protein